MSQLEKTAELLLKKMEMYLSCQDPDPKSLATLAGALKDVSALAGGGSGTVTVQFLGAGEEYCG